MSDSVIVELAPGCRALGKTMPPARGATSPTHAFLGMPYAQPPMGPLRFKAPEPMPLWDGDREAKKFGGICWQDTTPLATIPGVKLNLPTEFTEDCLYLNVFTPTLVAGANKAVMVFIHGGGFINGYSDMLYGTGLASLQDVVFVSINYRLNIFGFVTTGDEVAMGNYGLLDQIEALRWVQYNIRAFGGDPDNVTIFGESAGAISVSALLLSRRSQGLFHRAICQSGTFLFPGFAKTPTQLFNNMKPYLQRLGCPMGKSEDIMEFLQQQPPDVLMKSQTIMDQFHPVVDGDVICEEDVRRGSCPAHDGVDLMVGCTSHEGALLAMLFCGFKCPDLEAAMKVLYMGVFAHFDQAKDDIPGMTQAIVQEYLADQSSEEAILKGLVDCMGDYMFVFSTVSTALAHSKAGGRTYVYEYWHRQSTAAYPEWVQADHGSEMFLAFGAVFFDMSEQAVFGWDEKDEQMSTTLMKYWTNFAKNGDPSAAELVTWPTYDSEKQEYLALALQCTARDHLRSDKVEFWRNTLKKYAKSVQV